MYFQGNDAGRYKHQLADDSPQVWFITHHLVDPPLQGTLAMVVAMVPQATVYCDKSLLNMAYSILQVIITIQ